MTDKKMDSDGQEIAPDIAAQADQGYRRGGRGGRGARMMPGSVRYAQAQSSAPIKIGFQAHRTGIGAAYGRWYEKTTNAAIKAINDAGGINGRPVEIDRRG